MRPSARLALASLFAASSASVLAFADPPPRATEPVPDPGKSIASDDDSSAIAVNPANLAFLPASELRWTLVRTSDGSPLPARGNSFAIGVPIGSFATGLRFDFLDPPPSAPAPFSSDYHWVRWGSAWRFGETAAFGATLGWGGSNAPALDGMFSLSAGLTLRPVPWISLAAEARDINEPSNVLRQTTDRSWAFGIGVRPRETRALEIDGEVAYYEANRTAQPRFVAAVEIPRVGRVRGEVRIDDPNGSPVNVFATAGLDLDFGPLELEGGGVFGSSVGSRGSGFYAGAAARMYKDKNGVRFPARIVKITIDDTPGVRGHTHLLRRLWRIADDPEIEGVALVMKKSSAAGDAEPASSIAHAEEMGDAIRMLRARGKKVLCWLEDAASRSLYVCSQADRIAMNPAGGLRFAGIGSSYMYFGGLLNKLGVRADFVRIGKHKLAAEELTMDRGSDVAEQDHQELVDELEKIYLHDVGGGRRISMRELKERISRGPFVANEAREAGLVDQLAYEDEIDRVLAEMFGRPVRVSDDHPMTVAPRRWSDAPKIALVYLAGDMVDGESQHIPFLDIRLAGSRTIEKALKRAKDDPSVKAIVFRMETGGGSSLAADVMLHEAQRAAKAKPFVVSMGTIAASGGYYASMAGKPIFANPGTLTGSIGIFYGKVDVSGLLDKLGVHVDMYRSAPRADAESIYRPFTDDERRELGHKVKEFYDTFIARVHEGRPKLTVEQIDAVARGKVWIGAQAKERGLVDRLGGLREALEEARAEANLPDDAPILELPEENDTLLGFLLNLVGVRAAGIGAGPAALLIPPAMMETARALAPFFVYAPESAVARAEIAIDPREGKDSYYPDEP